MSSYRASQERVIVSPLPGNEDILAEAAAHVEVGEDEMPPLGAIEKEIPMTTEMAPLRVSSGYRPVTVNVVSSAHLRPQGRAHKTVILPVPKMMSRPPEHIIMSEESIGEEIVTSETVPRHIPPHDLASFHPPPSAGVQVISSSAIPSFGGGNPNQAPRLIYVLSSGQQLPKGVAEPRILPAKQVPGAGKKIRIIPAQTSVIKEGLVNVDGDEELDERDLQPLKQAYPDYPTLPEGTISYTVKRPKKSAPTLDATYAQDHSADSEEMFTCETCNQDFGDSFRDLRLHEIRTGHGPLLSKRQFKCSICLTHFDSGSNLARHYRMAHGRAANCPHCGIRFQRMEDLSLHVLQFHFRAKSAMDEATLTAQAREAEMAMGGYISFGKRKRAPRQPRPAFGDAAQPLPVPSPKFEMVQVGGGYFKKELPTDGQLSEYVAKIAQTPTEATKEKSSRRIFPSKRRGQGQSSQDTDSEEEMDEESEEEMDERMEAEQPTRRSTRIAQASPKKTTETLISIQGVEPEVEEEIEVDPPKPPQIEVEKVVADVQFCCAACKQGYRSKSQLKDEGVSGQEREAAIQEGKLDEMAEYVYECPKPSCGHSFRHFMSWKIHVEQHEREGFQPEFMCSTCCGIQYDSAMLEWHSATMHSEIIDVESVSPEKSLTPPSPVKPFMVSKSGRKRRLTPKAEKMHESEGFEALLAAAAHLDSEKPEGSKDDSPAKKRKISARKGGGKQPESKVLTMTRKNAATTKLPGKNNKEDAPSLDELNPEFLNRIQTVDQKRHFRQAHSEKLLQETLLYILDRLKVYSSTLARTEEEMDVTDCFVLLDCYQDLWRVFYPDYYNKVLALVAKVKNPGYEVSYPTVSATIANTYTQAGICKEPIPSSEPVVLFGRFVVNPKRRKARSNFACRKFPGTDYDSPSLDELSSEQIKGLGYDQARRFRRAHGEVFLYEMLRYVHKMTEKQQGVLLKHFWRYWWVFYPTELQLLTSSDAVQRDSVTPPPTTSPPTVRTSTITVSSQGATRVISSNQPRIISAKVVKATSALPPPEASSVISAPVSIPASSTVITTVVKPE